MKKILVLFIIVSFISCSHDDTSSTSELIGAWNWTTSIGGIDGRTETPESIGKTISIEFTDTMFRKFVDGVLEIETSYTIETGPSIRSTEHIEVIVYTNGMKQSFTITSSELSLFDECYDCFVSTYTRD